MEQAFNFLRFSEKVKELEKKLLKANQELEDCKQKHRTDIEFYGNSLESFTKTCIKEYTMIKNKVNLAEDKIKEINEKCVTKANFDTLLEPAAEACHPEHRCDQVKDLEQKLQARTLKITLTQPLIITRSQMKFPKHAALKKKALSKLILNHLIDFAPANIDLREKLNQRQLSLVIMMHQTHPDISTIQLSKMTHEEGIKRGLWDKKLMPNAKGGIFFDYLNEKLKSFRKQTKTQD